MEWIDCRCSGKWHYWSWSPTLHSAMFRWNSWKPFGYWSSHISTKSQKCKVSTIFKKLILPFCVIIGRNLLIMNLAVSDLWQCLVTMPITFTEIKYRWDQGCHSISTYSSVFPWFSPAASGRGTLCPPSARPCRCWPRSRCSCPLSPSPPSLWTGV